MDDKNVNKDRCTNTDKKAEKISGKRGLPNSPDDLPGNIKQSERQTKPRRLSYSAENLAKGGIDDTKVEQFQARKPGLTFNIHELICGILKDDSFIDKLVPRICDSVCERLDKKISEKYEQLVNDVVIPLERKVDQQNKQIQEQQTQIEQQKSTITAHVKKLIEHDSRIRNQERIVQEHNETINKMEKTFDELQNKIYDLDWRLDEQEQYSRRISLRFHNIPCIDPKNVRKMNTDEIILNICNDKLGIPITINEIGRTHPIGKVRNNKVQVIARFITYRVRNAVFSSKRKLKDNENNIFITENLTSRRLQIMNDLNSLRNKGQIRSCWSSDGRIFAVGNHRDTVKLITCGLDITNLLSEQPEQSTG